MHGAGYMCPLLVLSLYMHFGVCSKGVYSHSVVCMIILMSLHAHICISGWFSTITDVIC